MISHLVILVTVLLSLGAGPAEAGRKAPTLSELTQAVAQNPQDAQAHYFLGLKPDSRLSPRASSVGDCRRPSARLTA